MLHELLFALNGHHGDIFCCDDRGQFHVANNLPFLHPSEVEQLNRLALLGQLYKRLQDYIKENYLRAGLTTPKNGLYQKTLAYGMENILEPYQKDLIKLETELLANANLTVTHVQARLEKYHSLFPVLINLIDELAQTEARGCYMLEVLYKTSKSGNPYITVTLLQLLHYCHRVFYNQLSSWMLHGSLLDDHNEFFITERVAAPTQQTAEEDLSTVTAAAMQISESKSSHSYTLNAEMLPSYIPLNIANKILFTGEAVQIFDSDKTASDPDHTKQIELFAKELEQLSAAKQFDLQKFESTVDNIRTHAATNLYKCVVTTANLVGELQVVKDFFLLGRGELYLTFIDQIGAGLNAPITPTTQHFVNVSFQQAAHRISLDESYLQRFSMAVKTPTVKRSVNDNIEVPTGWRCLSLDYQVKWPLHIIFSPPVLESYNSLFAFLLYVKRAQLALQQCWSLQMGRHERHRPTDAQWWLRHHMSFLIDNLQYYLQADVIESQFSILYDKINSTSDFEQIALAHDNFVTMLLSQTFLLMKPISNCLYAILDLCIALCNLLNNVNEKTMSEIETRHLSAITLAFEKQSALLFSMLSNVRNHQTGPRSHVVQLLLRLDYNKYVTSAGGQLGSYQLSESVQ